MNKTALKTFATTARSQLRDMAILKAAQLGITAKEILQPSSKGDDYETYETKAGAITLNQEQCKARSVFVSAIRSKGFDNVIEQVAYTWFNRLIAVRYMEVNGYLPVYILGSRQDGKKEPDIITECPNVGFELSDEDQVIAEELRRTAKFDKLFQFLFVKLCSSLSNVLPSLFADENRGVTDYSKLLLDISYTMEDSVVRGLLNLGEEDFKEQVQIIGWLYQYYNSELKDETFASLKKNVKIDKDHIPAATQLFTPDWIVRYMVQNSVGRMYVEGHGKPSCKKEWKYYLDEAEQTSEVNEELNKIRAVYKEVQLEDIKILDPSMGSGHILVYAFDLLMQLYEEEGYMPEEAALLIAEKNLWGLDIDTRAWQLSSFALMMKVMQYNKKFFHANNSKWFNLSRSMDLHLYSIIDSNNIIISNPSRLGTAQFVANQLIDSFKDACEYGSLITPIITLDEIEVLKKALIEIDNKSSIGSFTDQIEIEEILNGLWPLLNLALVFIQKYDVVVTNPPYMGISGMSDNLSEYVKNKYPNSKADLFSCFIEKGFAFLKEYGFLSYITMQSWLFLGSFAKLRKEIIKYKVDSLLQIGFNSFPDLNSQIAHAAAFVFSKAKLEDYVGKYFNLNTNKVTDDKDKVFLVKNTEKNYFLRKSSDFKDVPNCNFAYSVGKNVIDMFKTETIGNKSTVLTGMTTADNDRFLRLWFEVDFTKTNIRGNEKNKWYPYQKGGGNQKWYGNNEYVVNWENNGFEIKNNVDPKTKKVRSGSYNEDYILNRGLTWSYICSDKFSVRYVPDGYMFDNKGSMVFFETDDDMLVSLGFLGTKIAHTLSQLLNPTISFQPGNMASMPQPIISDKKIKSEIISLVKENIEINKNDWDSYETSWDFKKHPLIPDELGNDTRIKDIYEQWEINCLKRNEKLRKNEERLNKIFIELYGVESDFDSCVSESDLTINSADKKREIKSLISYAIGCMMGRYSLSSPGLIYAGGNMQNVMSKYGRFVPDEDAIIPINDNAWFKDDIVERFKIFLSTVYGESTIEENLKFITDVLYEKNSKGLTSENKIRTYFLNDFYFDHIKTYQKNPIYWLFDSGKKNGFKALIYLHRYDTNTVERVHDEYLKPLQTLMDNAIMTCQRTLSSSSASEHEKVESRERINKLQQQQEEIAIYQPVLKHVALENIPLDLDDGIVVNYAKFQNQVLHRDNLADSTLDLLAKIK